MHPDTRAAITSAITGVEAAADQHGWGCPPAVFGLFDHTRSGGVGAIEVDPTLAGPDLWATPDPARPGETLPVPIVLRRFARQLAGPQGRAWLANWLTGRRRVCVGFGLLFEGWAGPATPSYQRGDFAKAPAPLRREVRVVAAVDTDLGLHRVARLRGDQEPTVRMWPQLPDWSRQRQIVVGLRALTDLATHI